MVTGWNNYEIIVLTFSYLFIYNLTLILFFNTLFQVFTFQLKSLYTTKSIGSNQLYTKVLLFAILNMAGIPPFWGFFAKLFIFLLLLNSTFSLLYWILLLLLFTGLYFYIQNVRFLNSSSDDDYFVPSALYLRVNLLYSQITSLISFLLLFGFFFTEELVLFFSWTLH